MKLTRYTAAIALTLTALAIGTTACSDDTCNGNSSSLPLATFYVGNSQQTIPGLTVMGIGVPGDKLLLDSASVKEVYLPLRATVKSTSFNLRRWMTVGSTATCFNDTITFDYEPVEYFHSLECGTMFNFDIKRVSHTSHAIDSVVLLTPHVTNSRTPAVRIHYAQ